MTKKTKKILFWSIAGLTVVATAISVPIIVKYNTPFNLKKISNYEPKSFKNEFKSLTNEQIEKINETIKSKKQVSGNKTFYLDDFARISFGVLDPIIEFARISKYKGKQLDLYKLALFELSKSEKFYNNLLGPELPEILNVYDYFKIDLDNEKWEKVLEKFYNQNSGLFEISENSISSNIIVSHKLFNNLFLYQNRLFKKYYNFEKIKSIFKNHNFLLSTSSDTEIQNLDELYINLVQYLKPKELEVLFDEKNIRNWIESWDKKLSNNKKINDVKNISQRISFVSYIRPSVKNYYPNLLTEKDLENEAKMVFLSNDGTLSDKAYIAIDATPNFLEKNNLLKEGTMLIEKLFSTNASSRAISIKNTSLSYALLSSQSGEINDKNSILNFLNERLALFEDSLTDGSIIPNESDQI